MNDAGIIEHPHVKKKPKQILPSIPHTTYTKLEAQSIKEKKLIDETSSKLRTFSL